MNVSAADLIAVHIVVFGTRATPDTPFKTMADRIVAARPKSWQRLMRLSEQLRDGAPVQDYEALAAAITAKLDAATTKAAL